MYQSLIDPQIFRVIFQIIRRQMIAIVDTIRQEGPSSTTTPSPRCTMTDSLPLPTATPSSTSLRRLLVICTMTMASSATRRQIFSSAFMTHHVRSRRRRPHADIIRRGTSLSLSSTSYTNENNSGASIRQIKQQRVETLRSNSKLSLAPMMEYTDRHFRHLVRLISDRTLLYTEMVAANAIAHERNDALLGIEISDTLNTHSLVEKEFDPTYPLRFLGQGYNSEGASVLQLGGSDPEQLFLAAKTVYEFNQLHEKQQLSQLMQQSNYPAIYCDYTALNLNCGCPSPKVAGKGCFGAALMSEPDLVRQLTTSMHKGSEGTIPITVKCRIGTDEGYTFTHKDYLSRRQEEEYSSLKNFIETVASDGIVTDFQIHARIAVLGKSYSPADNRKVPPLRYHHVQRLAQEFPELNISLNGGVESLIGVKKELDECSELDGVMVGRGFVAQPWAFGMADEMLYSHGGSTSSSSNNNRPTNRMEVLQAYGKHADYEEETWNPVKIRRFITKAVSHLFAGEPNAKRYRIALDNIAGLPKKLAKEHNLGMDFDVNELREILNGQPSLSELIMETATTHLSEEVLYRSPKESYEKLLWDEEQAERRRNVVGTVVFSAYNDGDNKNGESAKQSLIQDWQQSRREDERKEREEDSASVW